MARCHSTVPISGRRYRTATTGGTKATANIDDAEDTEGDDLGAAPANGHGRHGQHHSDHAHVGGRFGVSADVAKPMAARETAVRRTPGR